jgi:hypothetical protein
MRWEWRLRLALEVRRHHLRFNGALMGGMRRGSFAFLILIVIPSVEVARAFVLVGTSVLQGAKFLVREGSH